MLLMAADFLSPLAQPAPRLMRGDLLPRFITAIIYDYFAAHDMRRFIDYYAIFDAAAADYDMFSLRLSCCFFRHC